MSDVAGCRVEATETETIRDGLRQLLDSLGESIAPQEETILLPDAHYPYHPTTGQVTNPDVVAILLEELRDHQLTETLTIGYGDPPHVDGKRALEYLGYDEVADELGIDLLDVTADDERSSQIESDGGDTVTVPKSLVDSQIILVPTLRADSATGVTGGMSTLASIALSETETTPHSVAAVADVLEPAVSLYDLTYIYGEHLKKTNMLLASDDISSLDLAVGTELCGLSMDRLPHLSNRATGSITVRGVSFPDISHEFESDTGSSGPQGGILKTGYEWYSRLSGDAIPPHILE